MDDAGMRRMAAGLVAVRARTAFFHEHFGQAESEWKHDGSRVTHADVAISRDLFADLQRRFPEDQYFSEETDAEAAPVDLRSRFAWVVDPIDGTNNYALGVPMCAISLALLEGGVPVCGFLYDFGPRALYHGGPGIGLFADGAPVRRRDEPTRDSKILALHTPIDARHEAMVARLVRGYKLRAFGSGALHLAYAALGRIDACLDLTVKVWDIAAAWAFCQVTGVGVRFLDGPVFPLRTFDVHMRPTRYLAAAGEDLERLEARLAEAGGVPPRD